MSVEIRQRRGKTLQRVWSQLQLSLPFRTEGKDRFTGNRVIVPSGAEVEVLLRCAVRQGLRAALE